MPNYISELNLPVLNTSTGQLEHQSFTIKDPNASGGGGGDNNGPLTKMIILNSNINYVYPDSNAFLNDTSGEIYCIRDDRRNFIVNNFCIYGDSSIGQDILNATNCCLNGIYKNCRNLNIPVDFNIFNNVLLSHLPNAFENCYNFDQECPLPSYLNYWGNTWRNAFNNSESTHNGVPINFYSTFANCYKFNSPVIINLDFDYTYRTSGYNSNANYFFNHKRTEFNFVNMLSNCKSFNSDVKITVTLRNDYVCYGGSSSRSGSNRDAINFEGVLRNCTNFNSNFIFRFDAKNFSNNSQHGLGPSSIIRCENDNNGITISNIFESYGPYMKDCNICFLFDGVPANPSMGSYKPRIGINMRSILPYNADNVNYYIGSPSNTVDLDVRLTSSNLYQLVGNGTNFGGDLHFLNMSISTFNNMMLYRNPNNSKRLNIYISQSYLPGTYYILKYNNGISFTSTVFSNGVNEYKNEMYNIYIYTNYKEEIL